MSYPRLSYIAVAFAAGVWLAGATGPFARAPGPWLSLAALAVLLAAGAARARARIGLVLAAFVAAGAAAAAWERAAASELPRLPAGLGADDRAEDPFAGVVSGPIADRPGRRRFVVQLDPPGAGAVEVSARGRPSVLPGDRVSVTGRLRTPRGYRVPGAVDRRVVVARRGAQLVASVDADAVRVLGREASGWRAPARAQRWVAARIAARDGSATGRSIVRAMIAGDRGAVGHATSERFRAAGIAHVLAVSGLHMAATALLLFVAVRRLWAAIPALAARADATRAAALCAMPAAIGYAMMTGARVSTLRALVVVLCALAGAALRRRPRLLDALGLAALVLLAAAPSALFDAGFQLSFVATATLAVVAVSGRWLWSTLRATFWITLATAPIIALVFGELPTGGVAGNLVAVPLAELVILPVGLAGAALSAVWEAGGGALLDVAIAAAAALDEIAGWIAGAFPVLRVGALSWLELATAALAVGLLAMRTRRAALLAIVPAVVFVASYAAPRAPDGVAVTFLDVGQGDAAVVELADGGVWLIDAGGLPFVGDDAVDPERARAAPGEHSVVRFLEHRRIRRIDVAVLSHPHPDHVAGLRAVAAAVPIDEVWVARGAEYGDELAGLRVVHPPLGVARERAGAVLEVLAPRYEAAVAQADPVSGVNDNSLVVRLRYAGRAVLFPGDIEAEGEELLLAAHSAPVADVVKVPHHGSGTSSGAPFVAATGARWAVVSCGVANGFGFPAPEVVARWRRAGAAVLRTDRDGAVTARIAPDGRIRVDTFD